MAHIYLEDYVESLEHLPNDFRELMGQVRDKDLHYQEQRQHAAKKQSAFFKATKKLVSLEGHEGVPAKIRHEYSLAHTLLEEKMELANSAVELIDKHLKRLDHDLKQFEQEMEDEKQKLDRERRLADTANAAANVAAASPLSKGAPARKRKADEVTEEVGVEGSGDANEPLYCLCQQVSFGDMIACDNEDCATEWFHYPCVGLTSPPKGKWYCSDCLLKQKKLL